jgi:hypothetical protein
MADEILKEMNAAYRQHSGTDQLKPVRYLDNPVKRRFFETMLI